MTLEATIRRLVPVAALAVLAAALCAPALAQTVACAGARAPDLQRICERGELRVARYSGSRPPFFFEADGAWSGFDVDLGRDIARRLGLRYVEDLSAGSFDEVVARVASGEADLGVSKLSATLERALRVRFSDPYLTVYQAVLVNRLSAPAGGDLFDSLNSADFVIGALAGSSYVGYAEGQFPRAEVRAYDDFGVMMEEVTSGSIDAVLMDSARANSWRRANREQLIHVRTTIDKKRKDPLAMAVGWQDTHLLAWLNLYLDRIKADGTADALYQAWFLEADADHGAR